MNRQEENKAKERYMKPATGNSGVQNETPSKPPSEAAPRKDDPDRKGREAQNGSKDKDSDTRKTR